MTFNKINNQIIVITNDHVYVGHLTSKRLFIDTECQIGGATIDLEDCLISRQKESDLATFRISEITLNQAGATYPATTQWPPNRLKKGDRFICGGYPGLGRNEETSPIKSDFVSFFCGVTEIKEDVSMIQFDM
ncbi:serine protease [Marinicella meishanensis]|uniref:serine protease n=1 Tax=Marinicella meishanensis TaxID=2873263 RepID=UPI001CC16A94|nr:serine protease [Marinicella sp. NBU2979]